MIDVGIIGASGYTGAELLRLCAAHPDLRVVFATGDSQAGTALAELYPSLAAAYPGLVFDQYDPALLDQVDLVFCGLPHGASQALMPTLRERVTWVVDLAADFRLQDAALYPTWYGEEHAAPELLPGFAYGLPELLRAEIAAATAVATPGCYPTAAALAMAPLVRAGLVETTGIVVDAASGVSGAGRPAKANTTFCAVDEDFTAYGLLTHRHTPEMEQTVARLAGVAADDVSVLFTPHLAPMNRGMLATCYLRPRAEHTTAELLERVPRGLRRRAVRRRHRRVALHQGLPRRQHRPRDGAGRPPHRLDRGPGRHRQPHQGRLRPGRAVRQHPRRPARADRPLHDRGLSMSERSEPGSTAVTAHRGASADASTAENGAPR